MAGNINMLKNIIDDTIIKKLQIIFKWISNFHLLNTNV